MLSSVFSNLNQTRHKNNKENRTESEPDILPDDYASDKRKLRSFPCSPKAQKETYDFFNEEDGPLDQPDNVIAESVDIDPERENEYKEKLDSTTP